MCTVCGCEDSAQVSVHQHGHHHHTHDHQHDHNHDHEHGHDADHHGDLHYGKGPARAHAPGMAQSQLVEIERGILSKNDAYARENRALLGNKGITALNLVSSPGSGKTTFLVRTLKDLNGEFPATVIEGDQQTTNDADRIRKTGAPAVQVNTGKGCHLDAHQVGHAIAHLEPQDGSLLFIENVGNLVCPAAFDLGEACKVALLSVTEGEDKPLKYPDMFAGSRLMILTKIDLLPHLDFDVTKCIDYARRINPQIQVIQLSAKTGEGLDQWYRWLRLTHETQQLSATG